MKDEERLLKDQEGCKRGTRRMMIERRNKKDDEKLIKNILVMYNSENLSTGIENLNLA